MNHLFRVPVSVAILAALAACVSTPAGAPQTKAAAPVRPPVAAAAPPAAAASTPAKAPLPAVPAAYVPPYALEGAEKYKKDFLQKNSRAASDLSYRFLYNANEEACLEFTVTPAKGYNWPKPTWIGYTWSNTTGSIGVAETNYTLTKKKDDEAEYRLEERRKDPTFREIEAVVLKVANEYDYDFYQAYGQKVKYRDPATKKAVCDGYADAIVQSFQNHPLVAKVEKWAGHNHAWNVLVLKDGRKLYCDATWYDSNTIDSEGYVVHTPQQTPTDLTFDLEEFNSLGGALDAATNRLLAVHFGWNNIQLDK